MGISDKLADLSTPRFHDAGSLIFTPDNARRAIHQRSKGDVYTGLQAETFNDADAVLPAACQPKPAACGVLRWLLQPYRLEMGIRFWRSALANLLSLRGDIIADKLNEALEAQGDRVVVNLASEGIF